MWAFGLNNYKQLVCPEDISPVSCPIRINLDHVSQIAGGRHHTMLLKDDGIVQIVGRKENGRLGLRPAREDATELTTISALTQKVIVHIFCGDAQSFASTSDGKVYAWGMGSPCQLGTGSEEDALEPTLIESKQTEGIKICLLNCDDGVDESPLTVAIDKLRSTATIKIRGKLFYIYAPKGYYYVRKRFYSAMWSSHICRQLTIA
uniref:Uncharacterized protein n=1 Tax=Glossina morsitans morsitans TaxID=37546 RepID=A0A1B0FQ89_GLOMM